MAHINNIFHRPAVVLPVVHITSPQQAVTQTGVAMQAGADGVFLIEHAHTWRELADATHEVRQQFPDIWIGVNALDLSAADTFVLLCEHGTINGVWADVSHIDETRSTQPAAEHVDTVRANYNVTYFGGVAFKYQRHVNDLAGAARAASPHMDVLCTSGPATGTAPTTAHVTELADNATIDVAVASGVNNSNVAGLINAGATAFLVSSSVEKSFGTFSPHHLEQLVNTVHNHT